LSYKTNDTYTQDFLKADLSTLEELLPAPQATARSSAHLPEIIPQVLKPQLAPKVADARSSDGQPELIPEVAEEPHQG
jgi:hypothetical protein